MEGWFPHKIYCLIWNKDSKLSKIWTTENNLDNLKTLTTNPFFPSMQSFWSSIIQIVRENILPDDKFETNENIETEKFDKHEISNVFLWRKFAGGKVSRWVKFAGEREYEFTNQ